MTLTAGRCPQGHIRYPRHPRCPECQQPVRDTVELSDQIGTIVTWTVNRATPPGVRTPNPLAIVEFDVDQTAVRVIGQLTTSDVDIGMSVRPVYVEELRDPAAGIRHPDSQSWDGYRFTPTDSA